MAQDYRVPDGERIYVVGDIHGRLDLLRRLHDAIRRDAADLPSGNCSLVYLGDYVDRGLDSRAVVQLLAQGPLPFSRAHFLRGNHEQVLLDFLGGQAVGRGWMNMGGAATLASYGLPVRPDLDEAQLAVVRTAFGQALPPAHRAFLEGLQPMVRIGGYLFAHAGIRPGVPLGRQLADDLLWIRDPFLNSGRDHGCMVVHGHSTTPWPVQAGNRIGIDTAAYATGRLTCLVLEGAGRRFLDTLGGHLGGQHSWSA